MRVKQVTVTKGNMVNLINMQSFIPVQPAFAIIHTQVLFL